LLSGSGERAGGLLSAWSNTLTRGKERSMSRYTRRSFLRNTSAAAAAAALAGRASWAQNAKISTEGKKAPNLAVIGTGGAGMMQAREFIKLGANVVCFCDVDSARQKEIGEKFPNAKTYQDYRKMLDVHKNDIDAVTVGVPDHHHYPATILAMQMGKHCYTQKPLTHTVWEARQLAEAAKKYKVATQMGNQGHANEGWRLLTEWYKAGALGQIKVVHTWTNRPVWPQGIKTPEGSDPVPETLDWDVWLGPAPKRAFKKDVYHPFKWRGWWDFGCGSLGDMGCHTMDGLFWALDPGHPTAVEVVSASGPLDDAFPKQSVIRWDFPAKGDQPAFSHFWYDDSVQPKDLPEELKGLKLPKTGNLFIGTKATVLCSGDYGDTVRIVPEAKMKEIGKPAKLFERSPGHYKEWFMAITGEKPLDFPKSNFHYAAPMTATIQLGNIALKCGKRLEWDGVKGEFTNDKNANQYLTKQYPAGWKFDV